MKNIVCLLLLATCAKVGFSQRTAHGDWYGSLNAGTEIRVVFHITKSAANQYTGFMDSPDQGAKGLPVSDISVAGDSVHFIMGMINGGFEGAFANDSTLNGNWRQGGAQLPLVLKKSVAPPTLNRPQTPRPPYPYGSDDVEYDNADKSVHFGATLTYPSGNGKRPAAILITGSGQQDRDETLFEHRPFAVIADYLTKLGFVVLRVDDRGKGKTVGEVKTATSATFANDVETGIAFLKKQPQVDTNKIGLIGHSEGGLIAAMVSSRRRDIYFMVLLASPGESGTMLLADQNEAILRSQGLDSAVASAYKELYKAQMSAIASAPDTATANRSALAIYNKWKSGLSAHQLMMLGITNTESAKADIVAKIKSANSNWMKYFMASNTADLLEKTHAKVLALNGDKDVQVIASSNIAGIKKALAKSKSPAYEALILQGHNHLFQHCNQCTINEYAKLQETFSLEALNIMGEWLKKQVQQPKAR